MIIEYMQYIFEFHINVLFSIYHGENENYFISISYLNLYKLITVTLHKNRY